MILLKMNTKIKNSTTHNLQTNFINKKNSLGVWLWLFTCAFLTLYFFDYGCSLSIDLVGHYELIASIYKHWHVVGTSILVHTPYGYIFSAVLGTFLGSAVAGMQWAVLISLLVLWSAIAFALQFLPKRTFLLTGCLLLILLLINSISTLRFNLYGSEIVGNFFFAQLLAEAASMFFLVLAMFWERRDVNRWLKYLLLAAGALFIENTHLLPAVQLFGLLVLIMVLDIFMLPKKKDFKNIFLCSLLVVVTLLAMLINPAFEAMRLNSQYNGGLDLAHISDLKTLAMICFIVAILSAFFLLKWIRMASPVFRKNSLFLKYFSLLGIVISGLCLFQMGMLAIGQGSEYACKKYGFGLLTLLFIDLSLLLGFILKPKWFYEKKEDDHNHLALQIFQHCFTPVLLLVVFFLGPIHTKIYSIANMVQLEKSVQAYRDTIMEKEASGKFSYGINLTNLPANGGTLDFMISTTVLNVPFAEYVPFREWETASQATFSGLKHVGYLLTLEGKKPFDIPACRKHISPDSLVLLDGDCVLAHLKNS